MNGDIQRQFDLYLSKVNELTGTNKPLTQEVLITNAILTSKKLILETEDLAQMLLSDRNNNNQNALLIVGARLEMMIEDIKEIKQYNLRK